MSEQNQNVPVTPNAQPDLATTIIETGRPVEEDTRTEKIANRLGMMALGPRLNRQARLVERYSHKQALYTDLGRVAMDEVRVSQEAMDSRLNRFAASYGYKVRGAGDENGNYRTRPFVLDKNTMTEREAQAELAVMARIKSTGIPLTGREFGATLTVDRKPAMAKSGLESHMERKINKRAEKKTLVDVIAQRESLIYDKDYLSNAHPKHEKNRPKYKEPLLIPDTQLRERVANKVFGEQAQIPGIDLSDRIKEARYGSTQLKGMNENEKQSRKRMVGYRKSKGQLTAREAKEAKTAIAGEGIKFGSATYNKIGKAQRKANKKLRHSIDQVFVSRYRTMRLNRAVSKFEKLHSKYEDRHERQPNGRKIRQVSDFLNRSSNARVEGIALRNIRMSDRTPDMPLSANGTQEIYQKKIAEAREATAAEMQKRRYHNTLRAEAIAQEAQAQQRRAKRAEKDRDNNPDKKKDDRDSGRNMPQWEREARDYIDNNMTAEQKTTLIAIDNEVNDATSGVDKKQWATIRSRIYRKHYGEKMTDEAIKKTFAIARILNPKPKA